MNGMQLRRHYVRIDKKKLPFISMCNGIVAIGRLVSHENRQLIIPNCLKKQIIESQVNHEHRCMRHHQAQNLCPSSLVCG